MHALCNRDRRDFDHLFGEMVEQVLVVDLLSLTRLLSSKRG